MIKYKGSRGETGQAYGFILTKENFKRLKKGQPIHVNLAELNGPANIEIVIHYEESEQRAMETFKQFIGPDTIIHDRIEEKPN